MSDVEQYANALLEAARGAHEPAHQDEVRVRLALAAVLSPAPVAAAPPSGETLPMASLPPSAAAGASATLRLVVAGTLIGATGFAGGFLARPVLVREEPALGVVASARSALPPLRQSSSLQSASSSSPPPLQRSPPQSAPSIIAPSAPASSISTPVRSPSASTLRNSALAEPPPAAAPAPLLAAEVAALRRAQQAIAADPSGALVRLDELARRYPDGALREEAQVARVLALCRLSRIQAARKAARELLRLHPGSVHTSRVRASCAFASSATPRVRTGEGQQR